MRRSPKFVIPGLLGLVDALLGAGFASRTDDLEAFRWIRDRTPPGAVFAANTGDGGNLIPAIAHRAVIDTHFILSFYYPRELAEWRRTPVDYVYVSSEASPAHPRRYRREDLDRDPMLDLAFRSGEARIYRVKPH